MKILQEPYGALRLWSCGCLQALDLTPRRLSDGLTATLLHLGIRHMAQNRYAWFEKDCYRDKDHQWLPQLYKSKFPSAHVDSRFWGAGGQGYCSPG